MRHLGHAATLAIGMLIGAAALAAATAPTQIYTGCLAKDGTILRVAIGGSPLASCKSTEKQISWNNIGPEGPPGPSGAPGPRGLVAIGDLNGTPCTTSLGYPGSIAASVGYSYHGAYTEDHVDFECVPVARVTITIAVSGQGRVTYGGVSAATPTGVCTQAQSPCSIPWPVGWVVGRDAQPDNGYELADGGLACSPDPSCPDHAAAGEAYSYTFTPIPPEPTPSSPPIGPFGLTPDRVSGQTTPCPSDAKIDIPASDPSGSFGNVTISVTWSNSGAGSNNGVWFTVSGGAVATAQVKGGQDHNLYDYVGSGFNLGVAGDGILVAPDYGNGPAGISHVLFCLMP